MIADVDGSGFQVSQVFGVLKVMAETTGQGGSKAGRMGLCCWKAAGGKDGLGVKNRKIFGAYENRQ